MAGEASQHYMFEVSDETNFGLTGTPSWGAVRAWDVQPTFAREKLENQAAKQRRGTFAPAAGSEKVSGVAFSTYAEGLETAAGDGVTASQTTLGQLFEASVGTEVLGTGTTIDTSGGNVLTPTVVDASGIGAHTWVGFDFDDTTDAIRWRPVRSKASEVLTLVYGLPNASADADVVYSSASYQMVDQLPEASSKQFRRTATRQDRNYVLNGCLAGSLAMPSVAPSAEPILNWDFRATNATKDGSSTLEPVDPPSPGPLLSTEFAIIPYGTTTYSANYQYDYYSVEWALDNGLVERPGPHNASGVSMWDTPAGGALTFTATLPADDKWKDSFAAKDEFSILFCGSRVAGQFFGLWIDRVHIDDEPQDTDNDGILTTTVVFALSASTVTGRPGFIIGQG